jgi:Protein of unknown function (DUF2797)
MNLFSGVLKKMWVKDSTPITYYLELNDDLVCMNQLINSKITLEFNNHFQCNNCGKDLPIYAQGYCKNCFFIMPNTNQSVFNPELSTAHLNIEQKDLTWEKEFELQPHVVYLAITGGLKVGVTRKTQIPTRWIDQGAISAIILAETTNRYEAGLIEVALANYLADKTNYRKMLLATAHEIDLVAKKQELKAYFPQNSLPFFVNENQVFTFQYPVPDFLNKVESVLLKNTNFISETLVGIKGQYLIFESYKVINIRNHEGYCINLSLK